VGYPLRAGDEVSIHYGARSSASLALYSGFLLPRNPAECAAVEIRGGGGVDSPPVLAFCYDAAGACADEGGGGGGGAEATGDDGPASRRAQRWGPFLLRLDAVPHGLCEAAAAALGRAGGGAREEEGGGVGGAPPRESEGRDQDSELAQQQPPLTADPAVWAYARGGGAGAGDTLRWLAAACEALAARVEGVPAGARAAAEAGDGGGGGGGGGGNEGGEASAAQGSPFAPALPLRLAWLQLTTGYRAALAALLRGTAADVAACQRA
jgi:hypothetical protein